MRSNFRLSVLARVVALSATCLVLAFLVIHSDYLFSSLIVAGLAVIQTLLLFHYVDGTNRRIDQVLTAFEHSDFTHSPSERAGGASFEPLNRTLQRIAQRMREDRVQMEGQSRLLRAISENADSGLLAFDRTGSFVFVNPAARRLLGDDSCDSVDQLVRSVPPLEPVLRSKCALAPTVVKAKIAGRQVHLSVRRTQLVVQGEPIGVLAIHSITSELRDRERQAIEEMIPIFTHEIRNSLTPVASLASTVEQILEGEGLIDPGSPSALDIRNALQAIRGRSQGLLAFIEAYQSLVRLPAPSKTAFPVAGLVEQVAGQLAQEIEQRAVDLSVSVSPPDLHTMADPRLIEQVLLNLLLNALQAVEDQRGARIEVVASVDDQSGKTRIEVRDNGPGIPEPVLEKVFRPFFSTRPEGTGIGLSMCQRIAHLHGGDLGISSTLGTGTRVELLL
jgi:signal transduction histidine kinase